MIDAYPNPVGVALINEGNVNEVNVTIYAIDLVKANGNSILSVAGFILNQDVTDDDELLTYYGDLYGGIRDLKGYSIELVPGVLGSKAVPLSAEEEELLPQKLVAAFGLDTLEQLLPFCAVHDDHQDLQVRRNGRPSRYAKEQVTALCRKEYGNGNGTAVSAADEADCNGHTCEAGQPAAPLPRRPGRPGPGPTMHPTSTPRRMTRAAVERTGEKLHSGEWVAARSVRQQTSAKV